MEAVRCQIIVSLSRIADPPAASSGALSGAVSGPAPIAPLGPSVHRGLILFHVGVAAMLLPFVVLVSCGGLSPFLRGFHLTAHGPWLDFRASHRNLDSNIGLFGYKGFIN